MNLSRVVSDKGTGWGVKRAVFSVEILDGGAVAGRVIFAKDFLKVAVQKLNNSITHSFILCPRASRRLRWKTGFKPNETSSCALCQGVRPRRSCWKPSVRAPKVSSCFEFASDLRNVAALKPRARKFVLRRHAAAVRFSDRGSAVRRTAANLIHCALPLK